MTSTSGTPASTTAASSVQRPRAAEAAAIGRAELACFLDLIAGLHPDELDRPTHCSLWSVRDLVAHQASHAQSGSGIRGFFAQLDPRLVRPYRKTGMSMLDALNQAQVDRRKDRPFEAVVAELRQETAASIESRMRLHPLTRAIRVPVHPVGLMPLSTLLMEIFPRDMWIHRLDIADATGRPFSLEAEHNDAVVAGIVRDAGRQASKRLRSIAVELRLRGPRERAWSFGTGERVSMAMDIADFARLTSERAAPEQVLQSTETDAPHGTALRVLSSLIAPF